MEDEFIRKLKERYERGEISEEIYRDILSRYSGDENQGKSESKGNGGNELKEMRGKNYKCAGSCVMDGGKYGHISSAGSLKITGDIEAEKISSAGSVTADGNIKAEYFKSAGSTSINGDLVAEEISVAGVFKVNNVEGENIKIGGAFTGKSIKGEVIDLRGSIKCEKIRGERVRIKLDGKSSIGVIKGEEIEVKSRHRFFKKCSGRLIVDEIIGERVDIEYTSAKVVDCEEAIIGDFCDIETLKAKSMKISNNAKVKEVLRK